MENASIIASSSSTMALPHIRVNQTEISADAIAREMQYHPAESQDEAAFLAAQALVIRELLRQRAQQLGMSVEDSQSSDEENILAGLINQEVPMPSADESSLQRFYAANPEHFCSAPLVSARHILFAAAPDDAVGRSRLREQADSLISQLQQVPDQFSNLAREMSACPSKEQGGALGQISQGQTVPEFERQLLRLPEGLAHQPLESRYGWHVVWVDQRIDGRQLPFEAVRDKIALELEERVWQKAVVQYLETLIGAAEIDGITLRGAESPLLQ